MPDMKSALNDSSVAEDLGHELMSYFLLVTDSRLLRPILHHLPPHYIAIYALMKLTPSRKEPKEVRASWSTALICSSRHSCPDSRALFKKNPPTAVLVANSRYV